MTSITTRRFKRSGFFIIALSLAMLISAAFYTGPPISASSPQNTCIGIEGWPCGYSGPFTGKYYAGYTTLGCTPISTSNPCAVPQIAIASSFLAINNASYVIDWANQSFQWNNQLSDGSTISVSGKLAPIFYNKTAGSTFLIYHSNLKGLWNPQPEVQIQNTTLTATLPSTCTTTLTFPESVTPIGACYTFQSITQQQPNAVDNVAIPMPWALLFSLVGGIGLVVLATSMFVKRARQQD